MGPSLSALQGGEGFWLLRGLGLRCLGRGAGLAADPQNLELVLRRPLDPGRVRAHERVLDVLKHRANVLRQRHVRSSFCMRIAAQARVRASIKAKVRSISFIWIISASS